MRCLLFGTKPAQLAPTFVNHESDLHVRAVSGRRSVPTRVEGRIVDRVLPAHQELLDSRERSVPCKDQYASGINISPCCVATVGRSVIDEIRVFLSVDLRSVAVRLGAL